MNNFDKGKLSKRDDIPKEYKWRLEDIYSSITSWEEDYEWVNTNLTSMAKYHEGLGDSSETLLNGLSIYMALMEKVEKLYVYARMKKDEDNSNTKNQGYLDKAQGLMVKFDSASSFLEPELLKIPEQSIKNYIGEEDGLKPYEHYLIDLLRKKDHILSPSEERILALSGEMALAPEQIFTMINNADMRFPYIKDENDEEVELTQGRYIQFMENPNREVRKQAYKSLYGTYNKQRNTIAATLSYSIKKDVFYSKIRNYPSTLESALFSDKVPVEVYDNLIGTVEKNLEPLHKYISLRKKSLGLHKLHMYDLYVPIVKDIEMKIPFNEAKKLIEKALEPLGSDYINILRRGYENGWIDVLENEGKTSGAYSWGCYDTHPFVLLNYQENINNVFTLAHEMGHAIHSYLSNKNQPYVLAGYKIFVAEVASTLNEILLTNYLLKTLENKQEKAYILNHYLEQFRGTLYRQTMFANFEKTVHNMEEKGEPLTVESLSKVYYDLNLKYYGQDIVLDDEIAMEWARIPHFYSSFYVYKYATGFSAAAALAQKILKDGEVAVAKYLNFLSRGGSDYPIDLLKGAGVDMTLSDPIERALGDFSSLVDEMEKLL